MPEGKVGAEQTGARWLGAREYPRDPAATAGAAAAHSRSLRNGLIALALVTGAVIALVMAVPKVDQVGRRLSEGSAPWLALAGLCELGSCLGYVIVFQLVFYRGPSRMVTRLAWSELAANSIVPAGGLGGLGLGAWVLSTRGVPPGRIAERSAVMFILTSVPSFAAVIVVGALLTTGAVPGRGDFVRSALPASLALAVVVAVAALPRVIAQCASVPGSDTGDGCGRAWGCSPTPPGRRHLSCAGATGGCSARSPTWRLTSPRCGPAFTRSVARRPWPA